MTRNYRRTKSKPPASRLAPICPRGTLVLAKIKSILFKRLVSMNSIGKNVDIGDLTGADHLAILTPKMAACLPFWPSLSL